MVKLAGVRERGLIAPLRPFCSLQYKAASSPWVYLSQHALPRGVEGFALSPLPSVMLLALSLRSWATLRPDSKAALAYGGRRWTRMPAIAIYVNLLAITGTLSRLVGVLKSLTAPYTRSKGKGSL